MANVLETFFFLFDSDSKKVDKGLEDSKKKSKDLEKSLQQTDKVASELGKNFVDMVKQGAAAIAATLAVSAIKDMVSASADLTNETRLAAKAAYKGVEDYDAFAKATVAAGGSAEALGSTLHNLGMRTQQPLNYLLRMSKAFQGLSDMRANRLAGWMGIDAGLVPLLQKGPAAIKALIDRQLELGIVTKKDADVAKAYKDQLRDTNQVYDDIKRKIATAVLPYFTDMLKLMERLSIWVRDNKQFVIAFFAGVAAIIAAVYLPAIISAITATLAFLAPWLLIGAAVAAVAGAFALAYDDVMNFLNGNNSMIGELSKKWPQLGVIVHGFADVIKSLWDVCKDFYDFVIGIFTVGFTQAWTTLKNKAMDAVDSIGEKFPVIGALLYALGKPIAWVTDFFVEHWDEITQAIKTVGEVFGFAFDLIVAGVQSIGDFITQGPKAAFEAWGARVGEVMDAIAKRFPWLAGVIEAIKEPIAGVAHFLGDAFEEFGAIIDRVIKYAVAAAGKIMDLISKAKGFFEDHEEEIGSKQMSLAIAGYEGPEKDKQEAAAKNIQSNIEAGKQQIQTNATPLSAISSSAISNSTSSNSKTTTVTIDKIEVQTQSNDPEAVNSAIGSGLQDHIKGAIDEFDNGVAA